MKHLTGTVKKVVQTVTGNRSKSASTGAKEGLYKDYVSDRGKRIVSRASTTFGIDDTLIKKAIQGDEDAFRMIGQMGNTGTQIQKFMPIISENLKAFVKGTEMYNKSLADIYKTAGQSAIAIDKAGNDVALADHKYGHQKQELTAKNVADYRLENQRHTEELDMSKLKAFIDFHMSEIDHKAASLATSARPMLAQIDADRERRETVGLHLLQYGEDADTDLIPKKEYAPDAVKQMWHGFKNMIGM